MARKKEPATASKSASAPTPPRDGGTVVAQVPPPQHGGPDETEALRRQLLSEAGEVPEATDVAFLDALTDRAHLAECFFDEHVLKDPACLHNPELFRAALAVADALADFYQRAGAAAAERAGVHAP
jgi:hypothetical protein